MNIRWPVSLGLTVPLILLAFAAILSAVNVLYHVPLAQRSAVDTTLKHLAQELSRLQSTLDYLMLKGSPEVAQREIAVLAHNHDYILATMANEQNVIIASTRRAWLDRRITEVLPNFDLAQAAAAIRDHRAIVTLEPDGNAALGYASILMGSEREEVRPSRAGSLFLVYDLARPKAEARAQVLQQSLYWAGWVTALAAAMWLVFHVLLTRRTAHVVRAAERLAAGNLTARSALTGRDEIGRLSRAFDAMARDVADTQGRLHRDIAERERVEQALRVSEASYRAVFDAVEDAIFVLDVDTAAIVDLNPKACTAYGYTRDEMRHIDMGTLSSGLPSYTREDAKKLITRAIAGEQLQFEWHVKNKDGSLHWDEVFIKRVTIGGEARILVLAREITDRKMAEEALRASEEQYRAMFNASIDGLALWDAAGKLVETNPALWHMYGYQDPELSAPTSGRPIGPSYPPQFSRAVLAGESQHAEVKEWRKDGSALELEVHGIPMQYQGRPHVLTIARDITDKKRSAAELARQREALYQREKLAALGSLLAGVAHELNNPLSVVVARAVMLEEQGDTAVQKAAVRIRTAAERCARIVRTFLAMARQQQPERGPVAINEVISAALDITAYTVRTSSIDVELDLAMDVPLIQADADQLHQVLLNLIINAQQALQAQDVPRRIRISSGLDARGDVIRISVADNGPGIPEELRARIFEPYFTTKPIGIGTGVGLPVSAGIVEAHGGKLTFDCPLDGGTVFTIELPIGVVSEARVPTAIAAQAPASQHTILVVDDEAEIREMLTEILTRARHRVVTANSGREALERMEVGRFDVILTDIRMPDVDGIALFQEIRRRWPEHAQRVVFVTGDTLASAAREFTSASGCPVIEKPFLPSDVRRIVAEIAAEGVGNTRH